MCLLLSWACSTYAEPKMSVIYPGTERREYAVDLLDHALLVMGGDFQARPHGKWLPRGRDFRLLADNRELTVLWGTATRERENSFLPIRIPIYKGLIGWRIAVVSQDNQQLFDGIADRQQFKTLVPGQVHMWTDTRILRHNGITVESGSSVDSLYRMLTAGRFDYFPRSVMEVWSEYERHKRMKIHVDTHVLIHYPSAYYFYVNKDNHSLARHLEAGLERLIKNGDFDRLLDQHFGEFLARTGLTQRQVITLDNPFLSSQTPLQRPELWMNPAAYPNKSSFIRKRVR